MTRGTSNVSRDGLCLVSSDRVRPTYVGFQVFVRWNIQLMSHQIASSELQYLASYMSRIGHWIVFIQQADQNARQGTTNSCGGDQLQATRPTLVITSTVALPSGPPIPTCRNTAGQSRRVYPAAMLHSLRQILVVPHHSAVTASSPPLPINNTNH